MLVGNKYINKEVNQDGTVNKQVFKLTDEPIFC